MVVDAYAQDLARVRHGCQGPNIRQTDLDALGSTECLGGQRHRGGSSLQQFAHGSRHTRARGAEVYYQLPVQRANLRLAIMLERHQPHESLLCGELDVRFARLVSQPTHVVRVGID